MSRSYQPKREKERENQKKTVPVQQGLFKLCSCRPLNGRHEKIRHTILHLRGIPEHTRCPGSSARKDLEGNGTDGALVKTLSLKKRRIRAEHIRIAGRINHGKRFQDLCSDER